MVDVKQLTRSENENKTTHPERKQEESQLPSWPKSAQILPHW